jgi:hypothetical protein
MFYTNELPDSPGWWEGNEMALVADIYGLSVTEAMNLTDQETAFLLDKAQVTLITMAATSPALQEIVRGQLAPTLRNVRDARKAPDAPAGGVGAPNV